MLARIETKLERFVDKFRNHEVEAVRYLASMSQADRDNVSSFISIFQKQIDAFRGERVALIAYASSVMPEAKRLHPMEDIDIRVVTSAPAESKRQSDLIKVAVALTATFANTHEFEFKQEGFTTSQRVVQAPDIRFLEYLNTDPSFEINVKNGGHPLHISISGPGPDTLDKHLAEEKRQHQYFSVLCIARS